MKALVSVDHNIADSASSKEALGQFLAATTTKLSEGEPLDAILKVSGSWGIALRREMNWQVAVVRLPVEILGMIFQAYTTALWGDLDAAFSFYVINDVHRYSKISNIAQMYVINSQLNGCTHSNNLSDLVTYDMSQSTWDPYGCVST